MRHILLFLLLSPVICWAQETKLDSLGKHPPILKFSYLSIWDPVSSIQFALEYPIASKVSLQHEAGYVTRLLPWNENILRRSGVRLRNELRYYLTQDGKQLNDLYLAPEFLFLYYADRRTGAFGKGCDGQGDCAYFQYQDYGFNKQVMAWHFKLGVQETMFDCLTFDIYWGAGMRYINITEKDKPPFERDFSDSLEKGAGFHVRPSISMGFKIGYILSNRSKKTSHEQEYYRVD